MPGRDREANVEHRIVLLVCAYVAQTLAERVAHLAFAHAGFCKGGLLIFVFF